MKPLHPPRFLPLILAAAACVLAALCLWQVLQLKSQLKDTTLSQAEQLSAMDAALQALPHQMEDALHTQSSLLANYDWHYGDLNPCLLYTSFRFFPLCFNDVHVVRQCSKYS